MAKFVESFGPLSRLAPAVSRTLSVFRSSRSQPGDPHHKMTEAQARKEFEAAGFRFVMNKPDLPWQHLLIFEKP